MKKVILVLCSIVLCVGSALAKVQCFIAKENGKVLQSEGDCATSYGPQSTFKIALSLIGFDSGILKDQNKPSWSLPDGDDPYINVCKGDHDPRTWMRDSCLWYSRILTNKLGIEKFQDYITKFDYGNKDLTGDKTQNNGLTNAWVSSSLKISPERQVDFLQKVVDRKLPISSASYDKTKKIMFIQEMAGGWKLYGKTGNGTQFDKDGNKTDLQHGWFVGYIEKGNRRIVFASHMVDSQKQSTFASFRARNEALIKLWYLINHVKRLIFTGTPGSGKTSAIKELEKLGYSVIHEAATDIIKKEQANSIQKPWQERGFVDKITLIQKERQMNSTLNIEFYDRSPFCTYALDKYLAQHKNIEFTPSPVLLDEVDRCLKNGIYHNKVFFFENLGFIEHTDARKISYQDALIFEQIHLDVYKEFGFDIIMVPKGLTVTQRCEFILERVK